MKLNRDNYEEYFILYLDNELESESRREVELFAQENPDLKAELDILLQSKLTPDTDISFTDKGSLIRFNSSSVSLANYEEWLTSYIDNELTPKEKSDVEKFMAAHPSVQKELSLLQQAKLQPEAIVFPYKESLYRKEEKARVISIRWRRIAVAAVLLLAVGTTAIVLLNNKKGNGTIVKDSNGEKKSPDNTVKKSPVKEPVNTELTSVPDLKKEEVAVIINEPGNKARKKNDDKGGEKKAHEQVEKKTNRSTINTEENIVNNGKQPSNDLPKPIYNPNVNTKDTAGVARKTDKPSPEILTSPGKPVIDDVVTTSNSQPSDLIEQPRGNKGLRGFLRKVTRTIEKRTNIKATDDDDRLLIAGLAIKMN